jgi:hypothetical protein
VPDPELTDDVIAEAMATAERVACRPGDGRPKRGD